MHAELKGSPVLELGEVMRCLEPLMRCKLSNVMQDRSGGPSAPLATKVRTHLPIWICVLVDGLWRDKLTNG